MAASEDHGFDFSTQTIPDSWRDAAAEGPEGDGKPLRKKAAMKLVPASQSLDIFTACLVAMVVCFIGGYLWYQLEISTGVNQPWAAMAMGAAIAVAVRFGGGYPDAQLRAVISVLFYVGVLAVIVFIASQAKYADLYGETPSLLDFEQELLRSRLTSLWSIAAWLGGGVLAAAVSYQLARK